MLFHRQDNRTRRPEGRRVLRVLGLIPFSFRGPSTP